MKIALFTDGITPYVLGGIQRHSYYLCKYLARNGVTIDLYHTVPYFAQGGPANGKYPTPPTEDQQRRSASRKGVETNRVSDSIYSNENETDLSQIFTPEELKQITPIFIPFPKHKKIPGHYVRESYEYSCRVYDSFLKQKPDVDFVYSKNYSSWKYLEEKQKGKQLPPIGVKLHGYEIFQSQTNASDWLSTFFHKEPTVFNSRMADLVFSYGGKITEILEKKVGVLPEQIREIPTGISEDWLLQGKKQTRHNEKTHFIFLGRYAQRKGIHLIEKVIPKCDSNKCNFTFVGPIPDEKRLNLPNVRYTGPLNEEREIRKELQMADVLLCPSSAEGMPNVILEGMASGCAVIATDVGAVNEMVSSEVGILLDGQSLGKLSKAIERLINLSTSELEALQAKAVSRVLDRFTWSEIVNQKLSVIKNYLQGLNNKSSQ